MHQYVLTLLEIKEGLYRDNKLINFLYKHILVTSLVYTTISFPLLIPHVIFTKQKQPGAVKKGAAK